MKSLYGITPYDFYAFGFYLLLIGLLLILPTLDRGNREFLKKRNLLYLVIMINGIEIVIYSVLISLNFLPVLDPDHTWVGYYLIGFFVFFIGYFFVLYSVDDFTILGNYRNHLLFMVSLGVMMIIISLFTYWGLMQAFYFSPNLWPIILLCGGIVLITGGPPLLITRITSNKSLSKPLFWISIAITGIGILTYLAPTLALNGIIIPMTIFQYNDYYDYLVFGIVLILVGLPNILFSENIHIRLEKKSYIFITILALGGLHFFLSVLLLLTDTYFIETGLKSILVQMDYKSIILGMPWTVWYINGFLLTITSLIGGQAILLRETLTHDNQTQKDKE
jgi:hypothetical protein